MRRIVTISIMTCLVAALVGVTGVMLMFHTAPGRQFIIAQAEPIIRDSIGSDVEIGALSGSLPGRIILEDIIFSDATGAWLIVERLDMTWRPLRLLSGNVDIKEIRIIDARLLRKPPATQDSDDSQPVSLTLPDDLPNITIGSLSVSNFLSELGGETARLDAMGSLALGGRMVNAHIGLTSQNDKDNIDIAIELSPDAQRLFIDATIAAEPGGVITAFADLDSALFLHAKSDSPSNNAVIKVDGILAGYGIVEATLSGNLIDIDTIDMSARYTPGEAFSSIDEFATPITVSASIAKKRRGGVLSLTQFDSAIGAITGNVEWAIGRRAINTVSVGLSIDFNESYRPEVQALTGGAVDTTVSLQRRRDQYAFDAEATSAGVHITLHDGRTNLQNLLSGELSATLTPRGNIPMFQTQADLEGRLSLNLDEKAELNGLTIELQDGSSVGGEAAYSFRDNSVAFTGDIKAAPDLVSILAPSFKPAAPVMATLELSGLLDRFTANATIDAPDMDIGEGQAPPFIINAAFAGLPTLPTGEVTAHAKDGDGHFNLTVRSSEDGTIAIPTLAYSGKGFEMSGNGLFSPLTRALNIDLSYKGEKEATPWPDLTLVGDILLNGEISTGSKQTRFIASSNTIRANGLSASGFELQANGDADDILIVAKARKIIIPQTGAIEDIAATANIDSADQLKINLTTLSGIFTGNIFSLQQPASVSLDNGVTVDDLRLKWGDTGRITFDAAFNDQRWRAELGLSSVDIPHADGMINFQIKLDTNEQTPARGNFELRSLLTEAPSASINADFIWDGKSILISSRKDDDAADMQLVLPAELKKKPSLSVNTSGGLDGYINYDGRIDTISAYFPPELQTLEGVLTANVTIAGTIADPKISGRAALTDGAYTELQSGLSLVGLHTEAVASYASEGSILQFTGGARGADQTNADTITLNGELNINDASDIDLTLRFENTELSAYPVNTIRANGEINIRGPLEAIEAAGDVSIDELDVEIVTPESTGLIPIEIIAYDGETDDGTTIVETTAVNIAYDLAISADDHIFIRGRGLDSEWSAKVSIINAKETAIVVGAMSLRRGALDFSGRRFKLTRGNITFDRLSENNPLLDIKAEHEAGNGVTAIIEVSGRADEPSIKLTSTPTLPSEDVMALILFNKPAGELTALEALQTAQALASLGGIGPFGGGGMQRSVREAVGLDLLNINIDPEKGGGSLTVGKYVADGFFVSATQDALGESGAVRLQYEISKNISVDTEIKQDGDQTVSANWKRDF
jgi:translocation and assembly module TamB